MPPKLPKPLTREQKDKAEERLWKQGGSSIETEMDGVRYKVTPQGLVPITGSQAQKIIKKQRKPKTTK